MSASLQFTKTTSSRKAETYVRSRTLPLVTVITVLVAAAIPIRLCAQTPLSARTKTKFYVQGEITTYAQGINPDGAITGYTEGRTGVHGFIRDTNGNITTFDVPGATATIGASINPTGAIAGTYFEASWVSHGFVRDNDRNITTFDVPGGIGTTTANSIDSTGAITGTYTDANFRFRGFVRKSNGNFSTFGAPPSTGTVAVSISEGGITGYCYGKHGGVRSFLLSR